MLSIKVEPEDNPTWEEISNGRIIPEEHATISGDTGHCIMATTESVSSCLQDQLENGIKKEEASDPSQELEDIEPVTVQVTVHMQDGDFLEWKTENGITIKREDSCLGDEGCDESSIFQQHSHQMQSSVTPPMYLAGTSSDNTGVYSSELIVNGDSQQFKGLESREQRNSLHEVPHEEIQCKDDLAVNIGEHQCQLLENSDRKLDKLESTCTHEKSCTCDFCKESFHSETTYNQVIIIHNDKPFKCQFCEKLFTQIQHCKTHEMSHTAEKPFRCKFCEESFCTKHDCKRHEETHKGQKTFKCQFCEKSFLRKHDCNKHEMIHTGEKPFKCQFCEKSFISNPLCKRHEMTHTGEKPYKCRYCEKSFRRKEYCKMHEMTHTGEKPFKCQFCSNSYIRKGDCKKHEMTHTGEKPFKCNFCEKSFINKYGCRRHEMSHTWKKPFKCNYCEKRFIQKCDCKTHEMTHTGEKPFRCKFCEKSFTRKQHCKRHEMTHMREEPFK